MQTNKHITDFLQYYYELETPPEYAVLLTGLWGSGKTWFIQDFIKKVNKKPTEILYVSLYGIRSFEDIETEFFRLLHPFLSSKGVRIVSNLMKGFLKSTIKIDIDNDKKSDASIGVNVSDMSFYEKIDLSAGKLLVFDDLERCSIPIYDLMGYINQLVEHGKLKAVLIANEEEIHQKQSDENFYLRIKEKLVGRTFEIVPELMSALDHFTNELPSSPTKTFIEENREIIAQIYEISKFQNLRLLRHSLWEFDRLAQTLNSAAQENKALLTDLLSIFLAYSFEVRSGSITPEEIKKIQVSLLSQAFARRGKESGIDKKYDDIRLKYIGVDFRNNLVPSNIWEEIFSTGAIPSKMLNEYLLNSKYFDNSNQQNWVKLWHGENLSDQDFSCVFHAVEKEWQSHYYTKLEIVLHVFGLLLKFSEFKIYKKSNEEIVCEAKKYIDWLLEQKILSPATIREVERNRYDHEDNGYGGLGYSCASNQYFKEILEYIKVQRSIALNKSYPEKASKLLILMKDDPHLFLQQLIHNNHKNNEYYQVPILQFIDPHSFVDKLISLDHRDRCTVAYAFEGRYTFSTFNTKLVPELSWLKEVVELLQLEISSRTGKISWISLNEVIMPYFKDAIKKLDEAKKHHIQSSLSVP
jgi:hypothetical protein